MRKYIVRFNADGNVATAPRSGRPRATTEETREAITAIVRESGFTSAVKIRRDLHLPINPQTVRNCLHAVGYKSRRPSKKPGMTQDHKDRRVAFAQQHLHWDEEWRRTVFVDEKIFTTDESGRITLWRQRGTRYEERNLQYQHRQGRVTVSVWGSMTALGVGDLVIVEERMRSEDYVRILRDVMYPSAQRWFPEGQINLVQDNSGPHRGLLVRDWIAQQPRLHCLPWPALSPDLNPIENLWARIQQQWNYIEFRRDQEALIDCIIQRWRDLAEDRQFFFNLAQSMPRRLQAVLDNNGAPTRY